MGTPMAQHLKELDWPKILAEGRVVNRDLEVFYPQQRYLNFYLVPLEDNGHLAAWAIAIIFHDLTARRAQAREAIESEKLNAVTLLAAGVAHELGNPLNSLNIHLQLLERDLRQRDREEVPDEELLESVRVARSEVARLDTIINQFLGAVRPAHATRSHGQHQRHRARIARLPAARNQGPRRHRAGGTGRGPAAAFPPIPTSSSRPFTT